MKLWAGWELVHLTDRVIELRKDDPIYRRLTDRPGYVRIRAEPGMDRKGLLDKAMGVAEKNDALAADLMGKLMMPAKHKVGKYQARQKMLRSVFATKDQEPERLIYKP